MKHLTVRLVSITILLTVSLLLASKAHASFPYKMTISGPGLSHELTLWLTTDQDLIRAMQGGLISEEYGEPPDDSKTIFEIDWYWGACWVNPTPCTSDPNPHTIFRTQYYFDTASQHGYILYLDKPGYLEPKAAHRWLRVTKEFDDYMQRILAENGASPDISIVI